MAQDFLEIKFIKFIKLLSLLNGYLIVFIGGFMGGISRKKKKNSHCNHVHVRE